MIKELFYELYSAYRQIVGKGAVIVLFIASLLALYRLSEDNDRGLPGIILSPLSAIGCAVSKLIDMACTVRNDKKVLKTATAALAVCLCFLAVTVSGDNIFYGNISRPAENNMHIPADLLTSMDAVLADDEEPKVLTMPGWGPYFSAYSSKFDLMYEEPEDGVSSILDEDERTVYMQLSDVHPEMKKVAAIAHKTGCRYIVMSKSIWPDIPVTSCGYKVYYDTSTCCVYKEVRTP